MKYVKPIISMALALGFTTALWTGGPAAAETPKRGGILKYVVPAEPPSFDGHRETTFALIHPVAPRPLRRRRSRADQRRQALHLQDQEGRQIP